MTPRLNIHKEPINMSLEAILARADLARKVNGAIHANPRKGIHMSIPVAMTDSDMEISESLKDIPALVERIRVFEAVIERILKGYPFKHYDMCPGNEHCTCGVKEMYVELEQTLTVTLVTR